MRFIMIGGFLGAGKTTTIARLAAHFQSQGKNVGIVTNDQASDLVDTLSLRSQGFHVDEVAGACFCCNFNDLTATIANLSADQIPDIIIAEPVGSCTDLVATVIQPMVHLHQGKFDLAPFGVILKPSHGQKILSGKQNAGFSPKAAYIFTKQLEEADFAMINHVDRLNAQQVDELSELMQQHYPETPLLKISAKTGEGFDALFEMLARQGNFGNKILDLDYDIYAEGEAELGWLNTSLKLASDDAIDLDQLAFSLVKAIQENLKEHDAEVAHLKVIALWDGAHAVANLTSSDGEAVLSLASDRISNQADVVINARVAFDPDQLSASVNQAIERCEAEYSIELTLVDSQFFRPGRPEPTHRYSRNET